MHLPLAFLTMAGAGPNPCTSAIQEPGQLLDTLTSLKAQALRSSGAWRAPGHTPFPMTSGWKTFPDMPKTIYRVLFTLTTMTPLHPPPTMFLTNPTTVPSRIWEFGTRGGAMLRTNDHLEFLTAILMVDTEEGLLRTATVILQSYYFHFAI